MKNILFYKYIGIENPEKLKEEQFKLAKSLNLLGTILIAKEGINGCLSGNDKDLEKYKEALAKNKIAEETITQCVLCHLPNSELHNCV